MRPGLSSLTPVAVLAIVLIQAAPSSRPAQAQSDRALIGQVSSAQEGPMEGVLVSARRTGSTLTVTVVTDRQGRYYIPRSRLQPGQY